MSGNVTTRSWDASADDLTCDEAASLLGVPAAALERWARQLEFPHDVGGDARHACFRRSEIEALRDALATAHSVEGAVRAARASSRG